MIDTTLPILISYFSFLPLLNLFIYVAYIWGFFSIINIVFSEKPPRPWIRIIAVFLLTIVLIIMLMIFIANDQYQVSDIFLLLPQLTMIAALYIIPIVKNSRFYTKNFDDNFQTSFLVLAVLSYFVISFITIYGDRYVACFILIIFSDYIILHGFLILHYSGDSMPKGLTVFAYMAVFGTMIVVIALYAKIYYIYGIESDNNVDNCVGVIDLINKVCVKDFMDSLYFSIVTWTTLGYGDIVPSKNIRMIVATEVITGLMAMAIAITVLLSIFKNTPALMAERTARQRADH